MWPALSSSISRRLRKACLRSASCSGESFMRETIADCLPETSNTGAVIRRQHAMASSIRNR